jgi:hypothetical protein
MADDRASRAVDNEREEIEQYMAVHGLESHLNAAVNEVCLRGNYRHLHPWADDRWLGCCHLYLCLKVLQLILKSTASDKHAALEQSTDSC